MQKWGQRTTPMDQEVPQPAIRLLEAVQKRCKEDAERSSKLDGERPDGAHKVAERIADAQYVAQSVRASSVSASKEASGYLERLHTDKQMCNTLDRIQKDHKAQRHGAATDALNQLLASAGNSMALKMEALADKVTLLETPIAAYQNMINGLEAPRGITKQELFEHVNRTVGICDNLFMSATNLHDQVEQYKTLRRESVAQRL